MDETRAAMGQLGELVGLNESGNWKFNEPDESLHYKEIDKFALCVVCGQPRVCHREHRELECPSAEHKRRLDCVGQKWMIARGLKK